MTTGKTLESQKAAVSDSFTKGVVKRNVLPETHTAGRARPSQRSTSASCPCGSASGSAGTATSRQPLQLRRACAPPDNKGGVPVLEVVPRRKIQVHPLLDILAADKFLGSAVQRLSIAQLDLGDLLHMNTKRGVRL
jgi:hypothetical protein